MYAGEIVELGTSEQIFLNPMHPYTQALLRSIPRLKGDIKKLEYIPGEPPNLIFPLKGCPFNPRCTKAVDICTKERPHFVEVEKDHYVKCWLYEKCVMVRHK
jgi:peptide/nickel transport system ATP-binding protein